MKTQEVKNTKKINVAKNEKTIIKEAYLDFFLENGKKPSTVYQFMKSIKKNEADFYQYFSSFESIDHHIWESYFDATLHNLNSENQYQTYGAKEKVLAFFFSLVEEFKNNRSYVTTVLKQQKFPSLKDNKFKGFKEKFKKHFSQIISNGIENNEIIERPLLKNRYEDGFWLQFVFLLNFWVKDTSLGFENTDAAIEKTVNLYFELLGRGSIDMMIDFGKFLYSIR